MHAMVLFFESLPHLTHFVTALLLVSLFGTAAIKDLSYGGRSVNVRLLPNSSHLEVVYHFMPSLESEHGFNEF